MDEVEISLRMPRALYEAATRLALRRGVPVDQMLRQSLSAELLRAKGTMGKSAQGQIGGKLSGDFEKAGSWAELQGRLMLKGYILREGDTGLELASHPAGQFICTSAKLGYSLETLLRRFGAAFPGQTQRAMADAMMAKARQTPRAKWQADPAAQPAHPPEDAKTRVIRHV